MTAAEKFTNELTEADIKLAAELTEACTNLGISLVERSADFLKNSDIAEIQRLRKMAYDLGLMSRKLDS